MKIELKETTQPAWVAPTADRKRPVRTYVFFALVIMALAFWAYRSLYQDPSFSVNARLAHERIPLYASADAQVEGIYVEERERVSKGQMLMLLYDSNLKHNFHKIRSRLRAVEGELALENGGGTTQQNETALVAASRSYQLSRDFLQVIYDRYLQAKHAFSEGLAIRAELEKALSDYMQANMNSVEQFRLYKNALTEEVLKKREQIEEADKYVRHSANLVMQASVAGTLHSLRVKEGEHVHNRDLLGEVRIDDAYRFYANIGSLELSNLERGESCRGRINAQYETQVRFIGPVEVTEESDVAAADVVSVAFEPVDGLPKELQSEGDIWRIRCSIERVSLWQRAQNLWR